VKQDNWGRAAGSGPPWQDGRRGKDRKRDDRTGKRGQDVQNMKARKEQLRYEDLSGSPRNDSRDKIWARQNNWERAARIGQVERRVIWTASPLLFLGLFMDYFFFHFIAPEMSLFLYNNYFKIC
jgi:hypothetical protein